MNNLTKGLSRVLIFNLLILGLFSTSVVQAHNTLTRMSPEDGAVLEVAPTQISLNFSDSTWLMAVEVRNARGENILADFVPFPESASTFTIALPSVLEAGVYIVNWLVVGDDTHEIKGEFSFTIQASTDV